MPPAEKPTVRILRVGSPVEIRSDFDDSWSAGFTVQSLLDEGYLLSRTGDGSALPDPISPDRVRKERTRQTWWV
jgi:hypothetical protein